MKYKHFLYLSIILILILGSFAHAKDEIEIPQFPQPALPEGFSQANSAVLKLHGKKPADMVIFVRTLFAASLKDLEKVSINEVDLYYPIQIQSETFTADIPLQINYGNVDLPLSRIEISLTNKLQYNTAYRRVGKRPTANIYLYIFPSKNEQSVNESFVQSLSGSLDVLCYHVILGNRTFLNCYTPGQNSHNAFIPENTLNSDHSMEMNITFMGQLNREIDEFPKEIR